MYNEVNNAAASAANANAHEIGWEDAITAEGQGFVLVPEGDYNFTVTGFKRGRFPGSAKIPSCNKAELTLQVTLPDGEKASIRTDLILWSTLEWKVSSFFLSIGWKKHDVPMPAPRWDNLIGAKGRARISVREYTGRDGQAHKANDIEKFLEPVQAPAGQAPAQASAPQASGLLD